MQNSLRQLPSLDFIRSFEAAAAPAPRKSRTSGTRHAA